MQVTEPEPATPFALADTFGPVGNSLLFVARIMAWIGGLIFIGLVIMLVISIVGRKLFGFVVPGDVEVLQMSAAIASASFFAYCHMHHGDVKVDFFTHNWPERVLWAIDALGSLLVCLFGALIAWRSAVGAMTLREAHEESMVLAWPVWIAQALMVLGLAFLAVCGFYMFVHQLRMAQRGRP